MHTFVRRDGLDRVRIRDEQLGKLDSGSHPGDWRDDHLKHPCRRRLDGSRGREPNGRRDSHSHDRRRAVRLLC